MNILDLNNCTTHFLPMKFSALVKGLLLMALSAMFCIPLSASSFLPVITDYTAHDYNAGLQNWACTQGRNGEIYIGNNLGLLCFDGYHWQKSQMQGCRIVRSLLADGDSIFAGSFQEFGYFKRDIFGQLRYFSLSQRLKGFKMHEDEIWNIIRVGKNVYFQSFSSWFSYDGHKVTGHFNPKMSPLYFFAAYGKIYAQIINDGLYELRGDRYFPILPRSAVGDDNIVSILPIGNSSMILCTDHHGLFRLNGTDLQPFHTSIDSDLPNIQLNRAIISPMDSTLILGTIINGIYALDRNGNLLWHCNVNNHLYNNTVLRLCCDYSGNIWAALDNGVALIHTGSPYSVLIPDKAEPSIGMVYGLSIFGDKMYIATNQGAYSFSPIQSRFVEISNTHGQNWHITRFGSQILIGNNLSTQYVEGNSAINIRGTNGSSTCIRRCTVNGEDILLESSYDSFRVYKLVNGKWSLSNTVEGLHFPVRQFEIDHTGTIWASHMSSGLYHFELSPDLRQAINVIHIGSLSAKSKGGTMFVMKIRGRIAVSDGYGLYSYDDITQHIVPLTQLNNILHTSIVSATAVDDNTFWLSSENGYLLIRFDGKNYRIIQSVSASFFGSECNETSNNAYAFGGNVYFFLNNCIARYNGTSRARNGWHPTLSIGSVRSIARDRTEHLMPVSSTKSDNELAFGDVIFSLSFPNFSHQFVRFSYRLTGGGLDLKSSSSEPAITYGSLGAGDYHFSASAVDANGHPMGAVDYYFHIVRPFYASNLAIFFYICAIVAAGYYFARWRASKAMAKKRKEFEETKMKQDMKMLEQERIIAQQQQQLLQSELSSKGKELASMALDVVSKDRAIESLKETMREQRRKGAMSQRDMDYLLKHIDDNTENQEFWDIFQKNFDLIHEKFFRNLRERYPSLTSSDLKFCALLRLNLSTKDIAQFTNLTVRGVEAARYRLRKKLALPEGTSLVDFFIDFK